MVADYCPFERAVQTVHFSCSHAQTLFIGEKENIACTNMAARADCIELVVLLKKNARFTLKLAKHTPVLTHGQEMKLKCGGIQGIQQLLNKPASENDVHQLIGEVIHEYNSLAELPFPEIMRVVSEYRLRRQ
ncbi:MAG: hypothetical protein KAT25_09780 [Sulfuriflexus sp.]|nr:hypothetical protein [Sulfuriflexus sp.]